MKKLLSLVLSLALAFSLCVPAMAASESMANFQKTATYNNQFSDVSASYWATPSIKLCYEYGFMKGTTPKQFSPTGALTVAGDFTSYTAKATRGQMAYLFSRALPATVLPSINNVQTLPDVTGSTKYSQEIFSLYNAGVLTGSDVFGTFKPNDNIIRAEAAAILTRVALPEQRKTVVLMKQVQWGNAKIAVPQSAGAGVTENGYFSVSSQQDLCVAVANAATDKNFKGYNITKLFTPDSMSQMIATAFSTNDVQFKNMGTKTVTFGALKAYRTTGSALFNEGNYNCVVYTYISGDTMSMILLMAYENDIALQNMANGLMVGGVTASPQF